MKTRKMAIIGFILVALLALAGCVVNKVEGNDMDYPPWYLKQEIAGTRCGYGMATKVSQSLSIDAAKANALAELAQWVETSVAGRIKQYEEEAGVYTPQNLALTQKVVDVLFGEKLSGIETGELKTYRVTENGGPRYTTYIQVRMPENQVDRTIYDEVHNEEALYNQFKASQAFQELEQKLGERQ